MKIILFAIFGFIVMGNALAGLEDLNIKSDAGGDYVLGVFAHDRREYVLSGETDENVAGAYIKGIFRIRNYVKTDSEAPLAVEVAEGLRKSFVEGKKWLGVTTIRFQTKNSFSELQEIAKQAKLRRSIVVTINDLWTESYRNTSVNYKFTISVLDENGQVLVATTSEGVHDTREWACDAAAEILSRVLSSALVKADFIGALKG